LGYLARRLDGGIMSLNLSDDARNVMLDALAKTMDGGSIEILSDTQRVLAELLLSSPAGAPAVDGVLELNPITEEPVAPATGTATVARVLTRTGAEVLSCDVGDRNSDAVIKLTTATITAGGPVRLDSFQLSMP